MNSSSHYFLESRSSPNLARLRQNRDPNSGRYGSNAQTSTVPTSHGSHRHLRSVHISPDFDSHNSIDVGDQQGPDKQSGDPRDGSSNTAKLSRSERKRLWRKNLSAEKLAKLRERDALRKRVERMNMSAEKRRDLRTKDTARKAALRKERRMTESFSPGPSQSIETGSTDTDHNAVTSRHYISPNQRDPGSHETYRRSSHLQSSRRDSCDDEFTKIPVHSLLN